MRGHRVPLRELQVSSASRVNPGRFRCQPHFAGLGTHRMLDTVGKL